MSVVRFSVLFTFISATFAATIPVYSGPPACDPNTGIGCLPSTADCPEGCICNGKHSETLKEEMERLKRPSERVEFKFVKTVTNYGSAGISQENELATDDSLATRLHENVLYVFRGIMVAATLFIVCACICVTSVCIYCCHIRRTDHKLKKEVDALAKKLQIDVSKKAGGSGRPPRDAQGESCNVLVQDANVMCV